MSGYLSSLAVAMSDSESVAKYKQASQRMLLLTINWPEFG